VLTRRRWSDARERGSVLLLMPVAMLIFVILGAICVDFAVVFLAKRELSNAAAAAANDAATRALDLDTFYGQEAITKIDPVAAQQVASASVAAKGLEYLALGTPEVEVAGEIVTVTVSAEVATIFARAVPGGPSSTPVRASGRATAVQG
jgi:Flp pilus assembly protein TadG